MSINLSLTIAAMTENMRKQEKRREKFKIDLLKLCPFKKGEAVYLKNTKTGNKRHAYIQWIWVNDNGEFVYLCYHRVKKSYGFIKQKTEIGINEVVEKKIFSLSPEAQGTWLVWMPLKIKYKSLLNKFNKQII